MVWSATGTDIMLQCYNWKLMNYHLLHLSLWLLRLLDEFSPCFLTPSATWKGCSAYASHCWSQNRAGCPPTFPANHQGDIHSALVMGLCPSANGRHILILNIKKEHILLLDETGSTFKTEIILGIIRCLVNVPFLQLYHTFSRPHATLQPVVKIQEESDCRHKWYVWYLSGCVTF